MVEKIFGLVTLSVEPGMETFQGSSLEKLISLEKVISLTIESALVNIHSCEVKFCPEPYPAITYPAISFLAISCLAISCLMSDEARIYQAS